MKEKGYVKINMDGSALSVHREVYSRGSKRVSISYDLMSSDYNLRRYVADRILSDYREYLKKRFFPAYAGKPRIHFQVVTTWLWIEVLTEDFKEWDERLKRDVTNRDNLLHFQMREDKGGNAASRDAGWNDALKFRDKQADDFALFVKEHLPEHGNEIDNMCDTCRETMEELRGVTPGLYKALVAVYNLNNTYNLPIL